MEATEALAVDDPTSALGTDPLGNSGSLPPPADDFIPFPPPRSRSPDGPGLPERPHKRIKEKFRLERERWEKALNAKGDTLYRSKLRPPSPPPQSGGYLHQFGGGWGNAQPTLTPTNAFGWGGGPHQNPFGWGSGLGPSMESAPPPQQEPTASSPMDHQYSYQGSSMESDAAQNLFRNYQQVREDARTDTNERVPYVYENYPVSEEKFQEQISDSSATNEGENTFGDGIYARGQDPFAEDNFSQGDDLKDDIYGSQNPASEQEGFDFKQEEYDEEEYNVNSMNPEEENDLPTGYQMPSDQLMEGSDQVSLEGEEVAGDGTAMTVSAMEGSEGTQLEGSQRPRKQLKEKFMKDREMLEAKMNAKGDSIYRRAGDPIPEHLQQVGDAGAMHGGYGAPAQGRRFLLPHELRAQMALQKIARAALMAQARRRKQGKKARPQIVFL